MTYTHDTSRLVKPIIRFIIVLLLIGLLVLGGAAILVDWPREPFHPPKIESVPGSIRVLTANVGNSSIVCQPHLWKLCRKNLVEEISKNIQVLQPDIIALQELMPPWLCEKNPSKRVNHVCSDALFLEIPQVRQIVGDNYTIVCESVWQFDCTAVRRDFAEIEGCTQGQLCYTARRDAPLPGCDPGFSTIAITIQTGSTVLDVINAHPHSKDVNCRLDSLRQMLTQERKEGGLWREDKVLLLGDFNIDPWRYQEDASLLFWDQNVGLEQKPFHYISGAAEKDPPLPTFFLSLLRYTLDHVVSNAAEGECLVLGESPDTARLDGIVGGMDHRALLCSINIR